MSGERRPTGEPPAPEQREPEKKPPESDKADFRPPVIVEGKAKEKELRRMETELIGKYDRWSTSEARASLMGEKRTEEQTLEGAKEIIKGVIEMMQREDPDAIAEAMNKTGAERAHLFAGRVTRGEMTMGEVAAEYLSEQKAKLIDDRRKTKFAGPQAFADVKKAVIKDLEALSGMRLTKTPPAPRGEMAIPERWRPKSEREAERDEKIKKAVDILAENEYILEKFRDVRNDTLGHGVEESLPARRAFVTELIEDMIPAYIDDDNIKELDNELKNGLAELIARGESSLEQERLWKELLVDASAEELRREIINTKPGLRGGGQSGSQAVSRVIKGMLKDMGDPAALKRKKKMK